MTRSIEFDMAHFTPPRADIEKSPRCRNRHDRVPSRVLMAILSWCCLVAHLSIHHKNRWHVQAFSNNLPCLRRQRLGAPGVSTSSPIFAASTERSCIELIDPITGCEVVLVGCFHGSPSSAKDVEREVLMKPTDVIALELCASRFADLRKSMATLENANGMSTTQQHQHSPKRQPYLVRFVQFVADTIQRRGLSTGLATAVLGGVSGLQTALSGFKPGLEFTTALQLVQQQQQNNMNDNYQQSCDIILADQSVDETVEKVGKLNRVVMKMMEEIISTASTTTINLEETQWGKMARALRNALVGDPTLRPQYQVNVGRVISRNNMVIAEMARLMVPPVILTQLALTIVDRILFPPTAAEPVMADSITVMTAALALPPFLQMTNIEDNTNTNPVDVLAAMFVDALPHVVILGFMLTLAYSFLAVPVTQVILAERDDQLTRGIQAACRLAVSKNMQHDQINNSNDKAQYKVDGAFAQNHSPGRVVAVLGLLHINGVAQRLLAADQIMSSWPDCTTTAKTPLRSDRISLEDRN